MFTVSLSSADSLTNPVIVFVGFENIVGPMKPFQRRSRTKMKYDGNYETATRAILISFNLLPV